jgi:hypothetical protein
MESNRTSQSFCKEDYDVSQVFLAYLTFLGNATKVGIALQIRPEVVEVLAAKENWQTKLATYVGLRHRELLPATDGAIRRTATYIAACNLRDLIQRLIGHVYRITAVQDVFECFSRRDPKTNRPKFCVYNILDLCRAYNLATRVINRELVEPKPTPQEEKEAEEKERRQIREAIERSMAVADQMPGVDSVALTKDSLAEWGSGNDRSRGERPA